MFLYLSRWLLPGTWYLLPGTRCLVPSTWCQVPGIRYLVPSTRYIVPCTWYQVPGIKYQVPGTKYLVPGTWYQVPSTSYPVSPWRCLTSRTTWIPGTWLYTYVYIMYIFIKKKKVLKPFWLKPFASASDQMKPCVLIRICGYVGNHKINDEFAIWTWCVCVCCTVQDGPQETSTRHPGPWNAESTLDLLVSCRCLLWIGLEWMGMESMECNGMDCIGLQVLKKSFFRNRLF